MYCFHSVNGGDIAITSTGQTEERALEEINRLSEEHDLIHNGDATIIHQSDEDGTLATGFFTRRS